MRKSFIIIIFILAANLAKVTAQTDCLKKAQRLYDDGQLEQIPQVLKPCFQSFTAEEKTEAYKLLTLVYLYSDKEGKADTLMQTLLKASPDYSISSAEDQLFLNLYKQFRTRPRFTLGISAGTNFSRIQQKNKYGVYNLNEEQKIDISTKPGYKIGLSYNRLIFNKFNLQLDFDLLRSNFKLTQEISNFATITISETQNKILLPICIQYNFTFRKLETYFLGGISSEFLLNSSIDARRDFSTNQSEPITGASINMKNYRRLINFSALAGIGIKYKVRRANLYFDIQYYKGLRNQNISSERYSNNELVFNYFYLESDFKINMYILSLGYSFSVYKPQKLKSTIKTN